MPDATTLKAVARHLPLLRAPLLVNDIICIVLAGLCSAYPIYQTELALIPISLLIGLFDLIHYCKRKRVSQEDHAGFDQDIPGAGIVAATDGLLSVALLITWIIGLVAFSSWGPLAGLIATFGVFIAWSFHSVSFAVQAYMWMKFGGGGIRRCPKCDYDLCSPAPLNHPTDVGDWTGPPAQLQEPRGEAGSLANEYDESETDCLILKDGENKS